MSESTLFLIVVGVVSVIAIVLAYRAGGIAAVNQKLIAVQADTLVLDRTESALHAQFTQQQLDMFTKVLLPIFSLGLAITPDGNLDEAIKRFQDIIATVTDGKANIPAGTNG